VVRPTFRGRVLESEIAEDCVAIPSLWYDDDPALVLHLLLYAINFDRAQHCLAAWGLHDIDPDFIADISGDALRSPSCNFWLTFSL